MHASKPTALARFARWTARSFATGALVLVGLMMLREGRFQPSALTPEEGRMMLCFLGACLSLGVGWRWEAVGGTGALLSLALFYGVAWAHGGNLPRGPWFILLFGVPGALFVLSWLLHPAPPRRSPRGRGAR